MIFSIVSYIIFDFIQFAIVVSTVYNSYLCCIMYESFGYFSNGYFLFFMQIMIETVHLATDAVHLF